MPRGRKIQQRKPAPDPRYNSVMVTRLVNVVMRDGKKSTAQGIVYKAMDIMGEKSKEPALEVFEKAMTNAKPLIEVKSRRVGGSTYQIPTEIHNVRRAALALRWLIGFARKRPEKSMAERLAGELLDAANQRGATIKKREDTHKMADANKAFAHYRW